MAIAIKNIQNLIINVADENTKVEFKQTFTLCNCSDDRTGHPDQRNRVLLPLEQVDAN